MELLNLLPPCYQDNIDMKELQEILSREINAIGENKNIAFDEFFIETATKLLSRYEKVHGLDTDISKDIEIRRERIRAKIRGQGTTTKEMIKNVASAFTNSGEVEVIEEFANYFFRIMFLGEFPSGYNELERIIEEIKPAHLDYGLGQKLESTLQLQTKQETYPVPYLMCGTFKCGTKPYVMNEGISIGTTLNANTSKTNTSQRYKLTGTFKSGEAKL